MTKLFWKITRYLAQDEYELKARYLPALLFTIITIISLYYKYRFELNFRLIHLISMPLILIGALFVALIPKSIATEVSGYLQSLYFNRIGNPIIGYVNKNSYSYLLNRQDPNKLVSDMKKVTRRDRKVISKNIFYGIFRNTSFLILIYLIIDLLLFKNYIYTVLIIFIISLVLIPISVQRYAEQLTQSYVELKK
jgi:hypothetical protein